MGYEESDDLIVGRVLKPANEGYGFLARSVDYSALAVLPCFDLPLVQIVNK